MSQASTKFDTIHSLAGRLHKPLEHQDKHQQYQSGSLCWTENIKHTEHLSCNFYPKIDFVTNGDLLQLQGDSTTTKKKDNKLSNKLN